MKKMLKFFLKYFWILHKPIVKKNKKFRNMHSGKTCFILANGGSLKYYDISKLPKNDIIVCSYSLIDNRLKSLNIKYYIHSDSYSLYPIQFNEHPDAKKLQINKIQNIFNKIFKSNKIVSFVNITNIYSKVCRRKNIFYYHSFQGSQTLSDDISGNFTNCKAALDIMLGVAKYMGYSKAVLLGCDYLGAPPLMGHFYADKKPFLMPDEDFSDYRSNVKLISEGIELLVILPEGTMSPEFNYDSYENYFGLKKEYFNNYDFIDVEYLDLMREASGSHQMNM